LKLFLDTSQLYTGSASDLVNESLRRLMEESRAHRDISVEWWMPDIVRGEREYQMNEEAKLLLPTLSRLERLLGHKLGIDEQILEGRVRETIERQLSELGISVAGLSVRDVDWQTLISDAISRRPPFEKGKTEKGFRDAIIGESFMQLVSGSPKSPSVCRLVLITGDQTLAQAIENRTAATVNVRVLRSLDEVQNLINTLASNVTEQFVAGLRNVASEYFFSEKTKDGLFYTEKLREKIHQDFGARLAELPKGATSRENGTWHIAPPSFLQKTGQRVRWLTTIKIDADGYNVELREPSGLLLTPAVPLEFSQLIGPLGGIPATKPPGGLVLGGPAAQPLSVGGLGADLGSRCLYRSAFQYGPVESTNARKVQVAEGYTLFHVTWSVIVTANAKLTRPKIENLEWKETRWQ